MLDVMRVMVGVVQMAMVFAVLLTLFGLCFAMFLPLIIPDRKVRRSVSPPS